MNENQERLAECILARLQEEADETTAVGDQILLPQDLRELAPITTEAIMAETLPRQPATSLPDELYTQAHLDLEERADRIVWEMEGAERQAVLSETTRRLRDEMVREKISLKSWFYPESLMETLCQAMEEDRSQEEQVQEAVRKAVLEYQPSDNLLTRMEEEIDRLLQDESITRETLDIMDTRGKLAQEVEGELGRMALTVIESLWGTDRRLQADAALLVMNGFMPR